MIGYDVPEERQRGGYTRPRSPGTLAGQETAEILTELTETLRTAGYAETANRVSPQFFDSLAPAIEAAIAGREQRPGSWMRGRLHDWIADGWAVTHEGLESRDGHRVAAQSFPAAARCQPRPRAMHGNGSTPRSRRASTRSFGSSPSLGHASCTTARPRSSTLSTAPAATRRKHSAPPVGRPSCPRCRDRQRASSRQGEVPLLVPLPDVARSDRLPCKPPACHALKDVHPEGCTCDQLFARKLPRIDRPRAPLRLR